MSNAFVCILGIGTVFVGLICIIVLCKLMSLICGLFPEKKSEKITSSANVQAPRPADSNAGNGGIANKQEIIAGVCAVIAEELGTDVKNIKVLSFKKA